MMNGWIDGAPQSDGVRWVDLDVAEGDHIAIETRIGGRIATRQHPTKREHGFSLSLRVKRHAPYTTGQPHPPVPELPAGFKFYATKQILQGCDHRHAVKVRNLPLYIGADGLWCWDEIAGRHLLVPWLDVDPARTAVRQRNGLQVDGPPANDKLAANIRGIVGDVGTSDDDIVREVKRLQEMAADLDKVRRGHIDHVIGPLAAAMSESWERDMQRVEESMRSTAPPQSTPEAPPTTGDGGDLGDGAARFVPTECGDYVVSVRDGGPQMVFVDGHGGNLFVWRAGEEDPMDANEHCIEWLHPKPLDLAAIVKQAAEVDPIAQVEAEGCTWDADKDGPILNIPGVGCVMLWPDHGNCGHGDVCRDEGVSDLHVRAFLAKLDQQGARDA